MAQAVEQLREGGQTSMVVQRDGRDLGAIGLLDTPRETAIVALKRLHEIGIKRMIMISGDHQRAAEAIARETGAKMFILDPAVTGAMEPDAYLQIMERNLEELQRALAEQRSPKSKVQDPK